MNHSNRSVQLLPASAAGRCCSLGRHGNLACTIIKPSPDPSLGRPLRRFHLAHCLLSREADREASGKGSRRQPQLFAGPAAPSLVSGCEVQVACSISGAGTGERSLSAGRRLARRFLAPLQPRGLMSSRSFGRLRASSLGGSRLDTLPFQLRGAWPAGDSCAWGKADLLK